MTVEWKKLARKSALWVMSEVVLGFIGLDCLADYSEFLLQLKSLELGTSLQLSFVVDQISCYGIEADGGQQV